ncbi:hypothetical protein [Carboxydothermus hydrogenoformans]|uniref:Conserved domain protein n=1 Tax=Carboxydothermus hydrogenoformans (strain ATCC BAA-161 / DSM 6008 / Z-2901) TaxID=246194 RepID=Q3AA50_CARHZ|nr:hypothetical protein [Carboxydothermus hydrogenoformans]ABB15378.1 conserved domain protein [Carboxydothermus hydrogenoformans Z-2901]
MTNRNFEKFMDQGIYALQKGNILEAQRYFEKALKVDDNVWVRNNLAYVYYTTKNSFKAYKILEPLLKNKNNILKYTPNTFTFALASLIQSSMGNELLARRHLQEAEKTFDLELIAFYPQPAPQAVLEYTALVLEAAGSLMDHRKVYELYKKWQKWHIKWESHYLGAAACFNLGKYEEAAKIWESIKGHSEFFAGLAKVSRLVEKKEIPPFKIEYQLSIIAEMEEVLKKAQEDVDYLKQILQLGTVKAFLLLVIIERLDKYLAQKSMEDFVRYGGDWGEELAKTVLKSSLYSMEVKTAAAVALKEKGVFGEEDTIPIVFNNQEIPTKLRKMDFILINREDLNKIVFEALRLRERGKLEEGLKILENLWQKGTFYPLAAIYLAEFYREKKEYDRALNFYEYIEKIVPDNPLFLYFFTLLLVEIGDVARAKRYLHKLKRLNVQNQELREKIKHLEIVIYLREALFSKGVFHYEKELRKVIEEKAITLNPTIARGLKNMPVYWIDFISQHYNLPPARYRKDREQQIATFLTSRQNLQRVVNNLSEKEKELLKYLLNNGGFGKLAVVSRKFGSPKDDSFYWDKEEPTSTVGKLWAKALVFIGRATVSGRKEKVAVIPVELRELLETMLK